MGSVRARTGLKRVLLLLLWSFFVLGRTQTTAIVLIDPGNAGPDVDPSTYTHGHWVLWPAAVGNGDNRLASILSGQDWDISSSALAVGPQDKSSGYSILGLRELSWRGYFESAAKVLGSRQIDVRTDSTGQTTMAALFLGGKSDSPTVRTKRMEEPASPNSILVCAISNWTELPAIEHLASRTLVLEYPPRKETQWSRAWLYGKWPDQTFMIKDVRVPGLLPARDAARLLIDPKIAYWTKDRSGDWGGANRWFERARDVWPFLLGIVAILGSYVLFCAVYCVVNEQRGRLASVLLYALLLVPASVVFEGRVARLFGPAAAVSSFLVSYVLLGVFCLGVWLLLGRRLDQAATLAVAVTGLLGCLLGDETWSLVNALWFGRVLPFSPWGAGFLFLYVALLAAYSKDSRALTRVSVAVLLIVPVLGFLGAWWGGGNAAVCAIPLAALTARFGVLRRPMLVALGLFPPTLAQLAICGATLAPDGLVRRAEDAGAVRLDETMALLGSPAFGLLLLVMGVLALVGGKFFIHQIRIALLRSQGERTLLAITAAAAALALLEPRAIPSFLVLGIGAMLMLLIDALREA